MAQVRQTMQKGKVQYGLQRFVVDTSDDLLNLPAKTVPGSTAYVISTGARYMYNNENYWVRIKTSSSNSSGSGDNSGSIDKEWDGGSIDDEDTFGGAEGGEI